MKVHCIFCGDLTHRVTAAHIHFLGRCIRHCKSGGTRDFGCLACGLVRFALLYGLCVFTRSRRHAMYMCDVDVPRDRDAPAVKLVHKNLVECCTITCHTPDTRHTKKFQFRLPMYRAPTFRLFLSHLFANTIGTWEPDRLMYIRATSRSGSMRQSSFNQPLPQVASAIGLCENA